MVQQRSGWLPRMSIALINTRWAVLSKSNFLVRRRLGGQLTINTTQPVSAFIEIRQAVVTVENKQTSLSTRRFKFQLKQSNLSPAPEKLKFLSTLPCLTLFLHPSYMLVTCSAFSECSTRSMSSLWVSSPRCSRHPRWRLSFIRRRDVLKLDSQTRP